MSRTAAVSRPSARIRRKGTPTASACLLTAPSIFSFLPSGYSRPGPARSRVTTGRAPTHQSSTEYRHHRVLLSATAVAFLALAPPSQASPLAPLPLAPACDQFVFNGRFEVVGTPADIGRSGWRVFFTSSGRSAGTPPAAVVFYDGGQVKGNVTGGGIGGRSINFQIKWNDKPDNVWRFWGTIDDDGTARGAEDRPGSGAPWEAATPLACATPEPPPAQQPAPAQKTMATATSDVDIYNIAHDHVATPGRRCRGEDRHAAGRPAGRAGGQLTPTVGTMLRVTPRTSLPGRIFRFYNPWPWGQRWIATRIATAAAQKSRMPSWPVRPSTAARAVPSLVCAPPLRVK